MTSGSLFAIPTRLPASTAASVGARPAAPTMAVITTSQCSSPAASTKASGPAATAICGWSASNLFQGGIGLRIGGDHPLHALQAPAQSANSFKRRWAVRVCTGMPRCWATSSVLTPISPLSQGRRGIVFDGSCRQFLEYGVSRRAGLLVYQR